MTKFGETLALLRRRASMTQEGLAEALDVSRQAVGKWEAGQAYPAAEKLPALADVLHCSLDELLRGSAECGPAEGPDPLEGAGTPEAPVGDAPCLTAGEGDAVPDGAAPFAGDDAAARPETRGYDRQAVFAAYDRHANKFSLQIAAGVGLILMGVAATLFLSQWNEALGVMVMLALIAAAAGLFVAAGLSEGAFRKEYPVVENLYPMEELHRFRDIFAGGMAIGVGMVVLSPAAILLLEGWAVSEGTAVGAFMTILAGGVAAIVYLSIQYAKYHFKGRSGAAKKVREKTDGLDRRISEAVDQKVEREFSRTLGEEKDARNGRSWSSVIMLSATGLFLILGFLFHLWSVCWIVFPLGAILAGILKAVPVEDRRREQP